MVGRCRTMDSGTGFPESTTEWRARMIGSPGILSHGELPPGGRRPPQELGFSSYLLGSPAGHRSMTESVSLAIALLKFTLQGVSWSGTSRSSANDAVSSAYLRP